MNRVFCTILTLQFYLLSFYSVGQQSDSYEAGFNNGKELIKLKKYGLAMQAFKPLTNEIDGNPYSKIASYYYAVAAYEDGQQVLARDMFLQIANKYASWKNIDEVFLWLANIYLQEGDYKKGLTFAAKIKDEDTAKSAAKLKGNYLKNMSYAELDSLLSIYPSDKQVATNLADKILLLPLQEQDRALLENIVSVFELDKATYRIEDNLTSVKKNEYHVALLLPFMQEDIVYNPKHLANEWVINLYEGILMGVNDLKVKGITISLHLYDTKQDGATTERLIELDEMKHMDLIIGPLYPDPVEIVTEFAFKHKINMINPLSFNSEIVKNNPYAFLYMPSQEAQARHAADFVSQYLENNNAIIFYGTSERDSIMAYAYKSEIEKRGFSVNHIQEVDTEQGKKILDLLTNTMTVEFDADEFDSLVVEDKVEGNLRITEKDYLLIQPDSIGHIFVSSNDPALVANTITAMETRGDTTMLLGFERWLDQRIISLTGLNQLKTHLIAPTYIDKTNPKYESISELYKEVFNSYPTKDFFIGYEVMTTLGKLMYKAGNLFQFDPAINEKVEGEIFQGLLYEGQNSNQIVPIVKFDNAELVLVNPR